MPVPAHKLTVAEVEAAKSRTTRYILGDGGGLELVVHPSGGKNWLFRYMLAGKRREMGLGGYPTVDLKTARSRAQHQRQLLLDGKDPVAEQKKARIAEVRRGKLFAEVAEEFIALREIEWKHARQAAHWRAQLARYAYPVIGGLPVGAVDTGMLLQVLQPIWQSRTGVAKALRGRIEQVLDYAVHKGYCSAENGANPARWRHHLAYSLPDPTRFRPVRNFRSLPGGELGHFVLQVRLTPGVAAKALQFLILTGARTTEVSEMTWDELDERGVWTLPARVKGRREGDGKRDHQVPLACQALKIIESMRGVPNYNGRFVFPGARSGPGDRLGRSMSTWAMLQLIKRLNFHGRTVTHGLRSVLNSWALDHGVPTEPRKMMLSHVVGDAVEEAYRSTEMIELRRKYAQQWADYVDQEVARAAERKANRQGSIPASRPSLARPDGDRRIGASPIANKEGYL
jgi:integrase